MGEIYQAKRGSPPSATTAETRVGQGKLPWVRLRDNRSPWETHTLRLVPAKYGQHTGYHKVTTLHKRKARRKRSFQRWDTRTAKLGNAALAQIRLRREPEPRMVRFDRWQIKVRDRITGDTSDWTTVRSLRDAIRRLAVTFREAA